MTNGETALAARIRADLMDLEEAAARAQALWVKAQQDPDYLDGVALNLHGFYSGAERIFEAIARELDGALPTGPGWHRDLLAQVSAEVTGQRPPVVGRETRACLDEYRGFRHVVRSTYAFRLRASRVAELVADLPACHQRLNEDLLAFCQFLEGIAADGEA